MISSKYMVVVVFSVMRVGPAGRIVRLNIDVGQLDLRMIVAK